MQLKSNLCTTVTLGKWQGDHYIQGDRYIQVSFAENVRQLKILGSCPVTVKYRVTAIYRAINSSLYNSLLTLFWYKSYLCTVCCVLKHGTIAMLNSLYWFQRVLLWKWSSKVNIFIFSLHSHIKNKWNNFKEILIILMNGCSSQLVDFWWLIIKS